MNEEIIEELLEKEDKKKFPIGVIVVSLAIVTITVFFVFPLLFRREPKPNIVTESTLEYAVKTSVLSTYETVYNGIVAVHNAKKPEKVDYYISYEATIKAGLDFNDIEIEKDDVNKQVIVTIPEITLQHPNVPIEKLDFIIVNNRIKENGLVTEAQKKAIKDVEDECSKQESLFAFAEQNAKNLIMGLLSPFVEQLDSYTIVFK